MDAQQEPGQVGVGGEARLVKHHNGAPVEGDVAAVESPDQRPHRPGGQAGLAAECVGRLAAGGCAQHLVTCGFQDADGHVEGGGLARPVQNRWSEARLAGAPQPFELGPRTAWSTSSIVDLCRGLDAERETAVDDENPPDPLG
jgi:hypothetical protein